MNEIKEKKEAQIRGGILKFEEALAKVPGVMFGDCFPLEHTFVKGAYVRKITMPAGSLLTSKIHKFRHPYFVLKGKVSVLTETGVQKIEAPFFGITEAGTKRILYNHTDVEWYTIHATEETDLEKIEEQIIAKDFNELGLEVDISQFIEQVTKEELCLS